MSPGLRASAFVLACLAGAATHEAGTIVGLVRATGPAEAAAEEGGGNYASRRYRFLEKIDYAALTDFVVFIDQPAAAPPTGADRPVARIVQRGGAFEPRRLVVSAGTLVEFPNEDEIFHNVFSVSDSTPFDLGLYKRGDAARAIPFDSTGRIDVFCSIHTRMTCVVYVTPNAWFAETDARGRYVIRDVPAGTYRLKAWHDRLPAKVETITVPEGGEVRVDFLLGLGQPPRP